MWRSLCLALSLVAVGSPLLADAVDRRIDADVAGGAAGGRIPTPSLQQYFWHEQERLMFVCLDPCTWQGREYDNHTTPLDQMKLPRLDTDQWCRAAVAWGAKEILFVAKHTGGFCWWQTDTAEYSVKNIAWKDGKGDVLEELARSCGKHGLHMGIYVYPGDDTWGAGIGSGGRTKDPAKQAAYDEIFRQQLRETIRLASRHTRVVEVWFDGSCVIDVGDVLRDEAPEAVVFQGPHATIRWVGNERGHLAYDRSWSTLSAAGLSTGLSTSAHSDPAGDAWAPLEVNTTLYGHYWFWSRSNESRRKSLDELMRVYYASAGQGHVMLLNSTPNTDGLIPDDDVKLYRALGAEISRRFDHPVARTRGSGSSVELDLGRPALINHVVIMEEYAFGERIRRFTIEGRQGTSWKPLTDGRHVGRKRVAAFDDAVVSAVRLVVTESAAEPLIRELSAHCVTDYRLAPGRPVRNRWRQCGAWTAADFTAGRADLEVILTGHITEAGQWTVTFRPADADARIELSDAVLLQQGQASVEGMLTRLEGQPGTFNVNRTAVITDAADIRLRVALRGPVGSGVVLIRPAKDGR